MATYTISAEDLAKVKLVIRENAVPYFTDAEIQSYYDVHMGNLNATIYELLQVKAENTTLSISGLSTADTSRYFLRLATKYKPRNSGQLSGGWEK